MFRIIFCLVMFAAVMTAAQEAPVVSETETVPAEEAGEKQQVIEDVAEGAPETFDPTEEVSEDYSIEFPVDI